MRFAIEPKTDTGSNSSGDTSDPHSATTDTAEADEEEDDEDQEQEKKANDDDFDGNERDN